MTEDSDDDNCNCMDCYQKYPSRSFRLKEGKYIKSGLPGIKRGLLNHKPIINDADVQKPTSEIASALRAPVSIPKGTKQKSVYTSTPESIECEKNVHAEKLLEEEKAVLKCTNCIESNDVIEIDSMGAFRVICTGGCVLTLHRTCFEKGLGSGKKRELKTSATCPNIECRCKVDEINHRVPGKYSDFTLWLRCEVPECERPKKEEKGKETKKKDKTKLKRERDDQDVGNVGVDDSTCSSPAPFVPVSGVSNCDMEESPFISLALPIKTKEEEAKKNLVKPLPADLEARPMERKEDAVMSKYAVKETTTKEVKKKTKKEVQKVILPGLTVKGQRGRKDEDDQWVNNEHMEDIEQSSTPGVGTTDDNDLRYEEGPYGFAMPEEIYPHTMGDGDWDGNEGDHPFRHPLPMGHPAGVFRPVYMHEAPCVNYSSQPLHEPNGPLSGFTESLEEPPLIEDPFDYPNLECESIRKRKELVNFFERHTPVLEENASLFDSPQIDLDTLKCMLEQFIEFEFCGNEEMKGSMTDTLLSIFDGEVESDIIPFLIDLGCFKYGYVDGRLVVSTKTDRREREDKIRKSEEAEMKIRMEKERMRKIEEEEERLKAIEKREKALRKMEMKKQIEEEANRIEEDEREKRRIEELELKRRQESENQEQSKQCLLLRPDKEDKKWKEKELEKKTREAINALRNYNQSKSSSSDSSPERKELLKCTRATDSSSSFNPPTSSTTFYTNLKAELNPNAPAFIPSQPTTESLVFVDEDALSSSLHHTSSQKAELNPNAPAFIPTQPAEPLILMDEHGEEVDEMWIEEHEQLHRDDLIMIDELRQRVAQLEAEKEELEDIKRKGEIEISKHVGKKINEDKKNQEIINRLQSDNKEKEHQLLLKDKIISQKEASSAKQSEDMKELRRSHDEIVEGMRSRIREAHLITNNERKDKENTMATMERAEQEKRRSLLERKTACAKEAIIMCTHIINRLATDGEAQVIASIFIELRKKWVEHHSILNIYLSSCISGEWIEWNVALSLKEPSLPRETDELVRECYVWKYQSMHILSHRLATNVKNFLRRNGRDYDDVDIIGIIQKWMLIHPHPSKVDATVPQVANMVAQAMGDMPLLPARYVTLSPPTPPTLPIPPPRRTSTVMRSVYDDRMMPSNMRGNSSENEPKGWKKFSDKVRQVELEGYECCICLDHVEGGDISYCEKVSCNEPYHNDCLDRYWKTGGRNCPRCRTPMPPRDAFPALG